VTEEPLLSEAEARDASRWLALTQACLANGDDLVTDAEVLLSSGRPARALSLAVLATEEYGKAIHALAVINAGGDAGEIAAYLRAAERHPAKLEAGAWWAAFVNVAESLDEGFAAKAVELSGTANRDKLSGFYVDWGDGEIRTPRGISAERARTRVELARALGTYVSGLVRLVSGEQQLQAMWRYGPEVSRGIKESGVPPEHLVDGLRRLLPKYGVPLAGNAPVDGGPLHFLGIDLAWANGSRVPNETALVLIDASGRVVEAGWTRGVAQTLDWVRVHVDQPNVLAFVDAPLVVNNARGQRRCEKRVGQLYGRWRVSANSTNAQSKHAGGVELLAGLRRAGWEYSSGFEGPRDSGRWVSECYPFTTLVGASELGYDDERPRYKRAPRGMPVAEWRRLRAAACDELIRRVGALVDAEPPLDLGSHEATAALLVESSPLRDVDYKHREDLIDAALCAWTGALWARFGFARCQVLGDRGEGAPPATIIAPCRPEQRGETTVLPGLVDEG